MSNTRKLEIQVVGGLGNQLFGLAAGLVLAKMQTVNLLVNLKRVRFGSNLNRTPDLQNIALGALEEDITFINTRLPMFSHSYERVRRLSRSLLPVLVKLSDPDYMDSFESPYEQMKRISQNTRTVGGPFIDFTWVELAKNYGFPTQLLPKFITKQYLDATKIASKSNLAIHIRLGDYLDHPNIFPIIPESYYLNALENFRQYCNQEIHIFSDSPLLAQKRFPNVFRLDGARIMDPNKKLSPLETMSLMSKYENLIASNSTFSSWAGWFNSGKKVVTPIPHLCNDWNDTLPSHWVRMNIS